MPSQIDHLKWLLERAVAKHGKDALSVRDLQVQISSFERQTAMKAGTEKPRENPVTFQVGMRGRRG